MPRFLIELPHVDDDDGCVKALRAIEKMGSHFITEADWGCLAGTHSGYLIAELDSPEEARQAVPPDFRPDAKIVPLNSFTRDQIRSMVLESEKQCPELRSDSESLYHRDLFGERMWSSQTQSRWAIRVSTDIEMEASLHGLTPYS